MMQEREIALYNKVKDLYEEAKSIWKGVLFEILLDPINPEPGETAERHIIDYRDCVEDFALNDGEPDRELSLDELFTEIGKLRDYKNILKAANESIENIKEQYKDKYTVNLLRVLDYSNYENDDNAEIDIFGSESELETEVEEDAEPEEEWNGVWETDSGVESPAEYEQQPHLYSPEESEVDNESDSGLQTESDGEADWLLNWETGSESDRPSTPEPIEDNQEYEADLDEELRLETNENEMIRNWESDLESNNADSDEDFDETLFNLESNSNSSIGLDYEDEISDQLFSSIDISENSTLKSISKLICEGETTYKSRLHECEEELIILGPNCTSLLKSEYETIPWKTAKSATGALLVLIFGEIIPPYGDLNQRILADIYTTICSKFNILEHEVKSIIETICSDIQNGLKCNL